MFLMDKVFDICFILPKKKVCENKGVPASPSGFPWFRCRFILPFWWFRQAQPPPLQNGFAATTILYAAVKELISVEDFGQFFLKIL